MLALLKVKRTRLGLGLGKFWRSGKMGKFRLAALGNDKYQQDINKRLIKHQPGLSKG